MLHNEMNLRETLTALAHTERKAVSRFRIGSPCRFIRTMDVLVHIIIPEALEDTLPRAATYLRRTSPRWGRSWRGW